MKKVSRTNPDNSTNQDPQIPKMTYKGDFPYFKKLQARLVSVRLNEKKFAHEPCNRVIIF